jgi:hypothetical protein
VAHTVVWGAVAAVAAAAAGAIVLWVVLLSNTAR